MIRRALLFLLLLSAPAFAAGVSIKVGQSADIDVGWRHGVFCDDTSIVDPSIATDEKANTNKVTLKGLKPGRTHCRAGNTKDPVPPLVIDVEVSG